MPRRILCALFVALSGVLAPLGARAVAPELLIIESYQKISSATGITGIGAGDRFGWSAASLGDLDGPGGSAAAVAIGARLDDDPGDSGAIYILFLNPDGSVMSQQKISDIDGDPGNLLNFSSTSEEFGFSIAFLGDYDGDGAVELAVGSRRGDVGATNAGQIRILDIDPATGQIVSGCVTGNCPPDPLAIGVFAIASGSANFTTLGVSDEFGWGLANLGDWDGDGAPEIGVGAVGDDQAFSNDGAVYILYLDPSPTATAIKNHVVVPLQYPVDRVILDVSSHWVMVLHAPTAAAQRTPRDRQIQPEISARPCAGEPRPAAAARHLAA